MNSRAKGITGEDPRSGRGFGEDLDDAVDDLLDEPLVVALAHDADDGLGTGGPNHQPALPVAPPLPLGDRGANLRVLERLAGLVADVLHHLRQWLEPVANL